MATSQFLLLASLLLLIAQDCFIATVRANSKVHIVYMGERRHNDLNRITESHYEMLESILESKEAATDAMVYSYRHIFSGFAAKLTVSQAKQIAGLPGVIHVMPNRLYNVKTTRSWDYLGLPLAASPTTNHLLHKAKMGDGIIVGVIDSGVWPESQSYSDEGLGPIPRHWKGQCKSGKMFDAKVHCNKKLIGAKWFVSGYLAEHNRTIKELDEKEFLSARDANGHGTHTSSTAAGSLVNNVSYPAGLAAGVVRGGAPLARIAMYKALWGSVQAVGTTADIIKAFDEAVHDGVDLLSASIGPSTLPNMEPQDDYAITTFHAVKKGIPVIFSAGNEGPDAYSVKNTLPWTLSVAATTTDRAFVVRLTFGNNLTILGQSVSITKKIGFTEIAPYNDCAEILPNDTSVAGKVVFCFAQTTKPSVSILAAVYVKKAGGVALVVAQNPTNLWNIDPRGGTTSPYVIIDYELGVKVLARYDPVVKISPSKTFTSKTVTTKVAHFSSRGPNTVAPEILKPDIAAPGVDILAAIAPSSAAYYNGFGLDSGTSMAAPHISGVVALLKALHPTWSTAAIGSALVTTASQTDPHGEPIFSEGIPRKLADSFDYGGGLVNANAAAEPGLVYDMGTKDYIGYLCGMGYDLDPSFLTTEVTKCPEKFSILDMNLPSITIPNLKNVVTVTRTVTNVGPVNSKYKALVEPPHGVSVTVNPNILVFDSHINAISFKVTISTTHKANTGYYFGSLSWIDTQGVHIVKSPITVRTQIIMSYTDDD